MSAPELTPNESNEAEAPSGGLPVDPRAIALGLWELRLWLLGSAVAAAILAAAVGKLFAERVYTAETVMLFQAPSEDSPEGQSIPSLLTLLNMVKLTSNLEVVRERLKLPVDLRGLGAVTSVAVQPNTTLVTITAKWDDPKEAAAIANTLREAFLENQTRLRREEAEARIQDVEKRMAPVTAELAAAEETLRAFTSENRIVDLSQEARATLDELAAVNLLLEQARIDKKSIDLQVENTARIVEELQEQAKREQADAAAMSDAMSETNIRSSGSANRSWTTRSSAPTRRSFVKRSWRSSGPGRTSKRAGFRKPSLMPPSPSLTSSRRGPSIRRKWRAGNKRSGISTRR